MARHNQTQQCMIMLGRITKKDLLDRCHTFPLPPWFDPDVLPTIDNHQLVWFDEMHIKQEGGSRMFNHMQIRFRRDAEGKYDPTSEHIASPTFRASYKYANEARFCLGVAKVRLLDGSEEGRRCRVFDYTGKRIVSITEWDKK